jgi:hypothetical protein
MTFELKTLSPDALSRALEKAHLYRLLNEPAEAESISRDVLRIQPDNQDALVTLLLALTDQFETRRAALADARATADRLTNSYARAYYAGVVCERMAKALLVQNVPGASPRTYEWFREAMTRYEEAEALRQPGNDEALLRWNACARHLMSDPRLEPASELREEPLLLE